MPCINLETKISLFFLSHDTLTIYINFIHYFFVVVCVFLLCKEFLYVGMMYCLQYLKKIEKRIVRKDILIVTDEGFTNVLIRISKLI